MVAWKNLDTLTAFENLKALKNKVDIKVAMAGENGAKRVNEYKVPMISPSATDDTVLQDDNGNVHPYIYRTSFTNSFQGGALAQFANDSLNASKAVILGDNSSDYAQGLTNTFKNAFEGEIVVIENFTAEQIDFGATLTNIKNLNFDVLFVPSYYE